MARSWRSSASARSRSPASSPASCGRPRCPSASATQGRYQVDVGHAEFFQGLLDGLDVRAEVKSGIRAMLARRDFVALKAVLDETPLRGAEHELLLRFPALRG